MHRRGLGIQLTQSAGDLIGLASHKEIDSIML
jgi:hypothetical protein